MGGGGQRLAAGGGGRLLALASGGCWSVAAEAGSGGSWAAGGLYKVPIMASSIWSHPLRWQLIICWGRFIVGLVATSQAADIQ